MSRVHNANSNAYCRGSAPTINAYSRAICGTGQLRRPTRHRLRLQRVLATLAVLRQPPVHRLAVHPQRRGDIFRMRTRLHLLHRPQPQHLQGLGDPASGRRSPARHRSCQKARSSRPTYELLSKPEAEPGLARLARYLVLLRKVIGRPRQNYMDLLREYWTGSASWSFCTSQTRQARKANQKARWRNVDWVVSVVHPPKVRTCDRIFLGPGGPALEETLQAARNDRKKIYSVELKNTIWAHNTNRAALLLSPPASPPRISVALWGPRVEKSNESTPITSAAPARGRRSTTIRSGRPATATKPTQRPHPRVCPGRMT